MALSRLGAGAHATLSRLCPDQSSKRWEQDRPLWSPKTALSAGPRPGAALYVSVRFSMLPTLGGTLAILRTRSVVVTPTFSYQPVQLAEGTPDREGLLVFWGAELLAVLVRLSPETHDGQGGLWFLEAGFGSCADKSPPLFRNPEDAEPWFSRQMAEMPRRIKRPSRGCKTARRDFDRPLQDLSLRSCGRLVSGREAQSTLLGPRYGKEAIISRRCWSTAAALIRFGEKAAARREFSCARADPS